jgi:hypothetical protein
MLNPGVRIKQNTGENTQDLSKLIVAIAMELLHHQGFWLHGKSVHIASMTDTFAMTHNVPHK